MEKDIRDEIGKELDRFSKYCDSNKKMMDSWVFNSIVNALARGADPRSFIVQLIEMNEGMSKELQAMIENRPQRIEVSIKDFKLGLFERLKLWLFGSAFLLRRGNLMSRLSKE